MNFFKSKSSKDDKSKVVVPQLKILDPIDFQRVNGGSGDGSVSQNGGTLIHTAGASSEI